MNKVGDVALETLHPYRWVIAFICLFTYTVSMVSRFAWPPLMSVVAPDFAISMAEAGSYMTGFYIGYVITQIPSGVLADRFGVKILLTATLLAQAAATYLLGEISVFSVGFVLRIVSGLSGGCVYAACFQLLVKWFPKKERGTAFGLLMCAPSLGIALANAFVPVMEAAMGWRRVFNIVGLIALACAVMIFVFIKDAPAGAPEPSDGDDGGPKKSMLEGIMYVLGDRNIRILCLSGFCFIWAYIGFVTWGNTYLKEVLELSLTQAGQIMSGMAVIGMVTSMVAGTYAGKSGKALQCLFAGNIALIIGILCFGKITYVPGIWVFALATGSAFGAMNSLSALVVSMYTKPEWSGSVGGMTNCFWQLAGALVPVVSGLAIDMTGSFGVVWWVLCAGPICGIAMVVMLYRGKTVVLRAS